MEIDLDDVLTTQAALAAWEDFARRIGEAIRLMDRTIDPKSIPDEQARVEADGSLTVYVVVPGLGEMSLTLPPDQWARKP
jgi:hypothetical protein